MHDDENIDQIFSNLMGGLFVPYSQIYPIFKTGKRVKDYVKTRLKTIDLQNVRDFWKASRREELKENMQVSIKGLLSKYSPVFPGDPLKKREELQKYRLRCDRAETSKVKLSDFNAKLSVVSGQMVWRLPPLYDNITYLGLYQGTVRNSIPVFMDKGTYYDFTKLFNKNDNSYSLQANISGILIPYTQYSFIDANIPKYSIYLSKNNLNAYVKRICQADYLDGDIWIWIKENGKNKIITRFLDLIDNDDFISECNHLREDINEGAKLMMQFDQLHKRIFTEQEIDIYEFIKRGIKQNIKI